MCCADFVSIFFCFVLFFGWEVEAKEKIIETELKAKTQQSKERKNAKNNITQTLETFLSQPMNILPCV